MPNNVTSDKLVYVVLIVTISKIDNKPGYHTKSTCSGTLIREDLVLTAAHCFQDQDLIKEVNIKLLSGIVRKALSIHIHPDFSQNGSDLALLTCYSTELNITPNLPVTKPNIFGNYSCQIAGFGGTDPQLEHIKTTYINHTKSFIIPIDSFIQVIFFENPPCMGDSGGPLICEGTLYGVLSKGSVTSCMEKNSITIYEDVFYNLKWLQPFLRTPITHYTESANPLIYGLALLLWVLILAFICCTIKVALQLNRYFL